MIVLRESQAWYHYPYEVNAFDYGGEIRKIKAYYSYIDGVSSQYFPILLLLFLWAFSHYYSSLLFYMYK